MNKYRLAARQIASVFNEHNLTYDESRKVVQLARKHVGITQEQKPRKLPKMPTMAEVVKFWETLEKSNHLRNIILLKLMYLTGARVSELVKLRISDVDIDERRIYIDQGKGRKDRYVMFPESFALTLRAYLIQCEGQRFLFQSPRGGHISKRTAQHWAQQYTVASGIDTNIHPHKLRHMLITHLTEQGMPEAQIMLISGHASKDSLAIYQHVALSKTQENYEKAMKERD